MNFTDIKRIWQEMVNPRVLVIGDIILDQYSYGSVSRISPEAPVPIFENDYDEFYLGGAANVAFNLKKLGADVTLFGVVGNDLNKNILITHLKQSGVNFNGLVVDRNRPTTIKKRIVANRQQLLRVDYEKTDPIGKFTTKQLLKKVLKKIPNTEAIILVDYNKGCMHEKLVPVIIKEAKKRNIITSADLKPVNKRHFVGVTMVAPNVREGKEMTGMRDVKSIGKALVKYFKSDVFLTRGEEGISVFSKKGKMYHHPAIQGEVLDVSGAGDTVIAVATLGYIAKLSHRSISFLANRAAGLTVQKRGTTTINSGELFDFA